MSTQNSKGYGFGWGGGRPILHRIEYPRFMCMITWKLASNPVSKTSKLCALIWEVLNALSNLDLYSMSRVVLSKPLSKGLVTHILVPAAEVAYLRTNRTCTENMCLTERAGGGGVFFFLGRK